MMAMVKWFRGLVFRLLLLLPDRISVRMLPAPVRYDPAQIPPRIKAPAGDTRLLIAPANYAAQGFAWARAVERLEGVGAVNMHVVPEVNDYGFPADYRIPHRVFNYASQWSRRHRRAVLGGFTHVLVEAERPLLGRVSGLDVARDVELLRAGGVRVGFVSHGTDLRLPSRHVVIDEWSPFGDAEDPWVRVREERAAANHALLDRLGGPVFVPTPELLVDRPDAVWLPIVVDPGRWAVSVGPSLSGRVRVLHAPTSGRVKGTELIEPTVVALDAAGVIEYVPRSGVPSGEMPAVYAGVDVVLEQFRLGIYATTAIEAMAAGRLVVGYVRDQVRDHVREVTGFDVPVVQATADSLEGVLRDVVAGPEHYRQVAARGPEFVRAVHDGTYSAHVLADFLTGSAA